MKKFTKLALAAAVAVAPASGLAMEALDDSALSDVTGQDGIRIDLQNDVSATVVIHDTDGFTGETNSGAIILNGFGISRALAADVIRVEIDAAGNVTGGGDTLQINVDTPANMTVDLGTLQVANSNRVAGDAVGVNWGTGAATNVATLGELTLGSTSLNIQLGAEPQGAMIVQNAVITGGIDLQNFSISDAGGAVSGGSISMTNLAIVDNGGTDLTIDARIDADGTALVLNTVTFGSANGADLRIVDLTLGGGNPLGDVEIQGLNLTGTIRISGK